MALVHSLLAAGIPFALFPASPTPYELKHLVRISKIKKIFTSPRNLENARIAAKEGGFSEANGVFILEGQVKGVGSFDDIVRSVNEPAKDYAKPVGKEALAYLTFSSGTTGPPKGDVAMNTIVLLVLTIRYLLIAVMLSHKNIMVSTMQGFISGALNGAVAPVSSRTKSNVIHINRRCLRTSAPATYWRANHIGSHSILPQLRLDRFLLPFVCDPKHHRHHPQMGHNARSQAYSKAQDSGANARAIDDPSTGHSPGVGED